MAETPISLFVSDLMTTTPPPCLQWFWGFHGPGDKFTWLHLVKFLCFYCCSVAKLCPTLCDPMDCSTQGFPVHYQLMELTQTQVHQVHDATQLSHPLSSSSPPTFNISQHQGLFKWVSSLHQVAKTLEFQPFSKNIVKKSELRSWRAGGTSGAGDWVTMQLYFQSVL